LFFDKNQQNIWINSPTKNQLQSKLSEENNTTYDEFKSFSEANLVDYDMGENCLKENNGILDKNYIEENQENYGKLPVINNYSSGDQFKSFDEGNLEDNDLTYDKNFIGENYNENSEIKKSTSQDI